MPRDAADHAVGEVVAEGRAEDDERAAAPRAVGIDREVAARADAEREAIAVEARFQPSLGHDAVAARKPRIALVEPADRCAHDRPECVPVLGARRARALRLEAVDYGAAAHEHELVAPHRDLTRDRVAGEASVLVETIAHSGEELRRIE